MEFSWIINCKDSFSPPVLSNFSIFQKEMLVYTYSYLLIWEANIYLYTVSMDTRKMKQYMFHSMNFFSQTVLTLLFFFVVDKNEVH